MASSVRMDAERDQTPADGPSITRRDALKVLAGGGIAASGVAVADTLTDSPRSQPQPPARPSIVGHRGAAGLAPPNTIPAIRRAIEVGTDGVELDVRQTRDGTLITFHDPVLDRKTTGTGIVSQVPYADLQSVRVNGEAPIPTLSEALAVLAPTDQSILLELKTGGITEDILQLVDEHGLVDRTMLVAFDVPYLTPAEGTAVQRGLLGKLPLHSVTETAQRHGYEFAIPHYVPEQMEAFTSQTWGTGVKPGIWSLMATREGIQESLRARPAFLATNRPDIALNLREELVDSS